VSVPALFLTLLSPGKRASPGQEAIDHRIYLELAGKNKLAKIKRGDFPMYTEKGREIEAISEFIRVHPESTVSRRIIRELFGASTEPPDLSLQMLQKRLEAADEGIVDNYYTLTQ